jgi:hypothetical protein
LDRLVASGDLLFDVWKKMEVELGSEFLERARLLAMVPEERLDEFIALSTEDSGKMFGRVSVRAAHKILRKYGLE